MESVSGIKMSYTALYRKFRPQEFEDVKGQEHIVTTLKNQIKADRIGHAYLFCGTRGTGKTTIAKIFAKAVNCEHPVDGSPCGECPACKAIAAGNSMNVIEIDAASNNGVDNIRQIREEVEYRPTEGKYKVYIIDEVHMLSIGAFNALLKTLEEPPSYVIFILATTEAHKIPITILSRCQRYDFRRISIETISARLMELMEKEQVTVEERADASKKNMGLTSFKGAKVRKSDITIAKNYLTQEELENLNRIVTMYLDYAEDQAKRHIPMYMNDWENRLDAFLQFTGRSVLDNAGHISREAADKFVNEQYALFDHNRHCLESEDSMELDALPILPKK